MSDCELEPITRKRQQFRKLLLARERITQLERAIARRRLAQDIASTNSSGAPSATNKRAHHWYPIPST
jgi:tmRNA-binding protein